MSKHKVVGSAYLKMGESNALVEYEGHWDNDGIGKYEYWGAVCFDKGVDYLMVEDIRPVFTDETPEEREEIKKLLHENFERYAEEISDLHGGND